MYMYLKFQDSVWFREVLSEYQLLVLGFGVFQYLFGLRVFFSGEKFIF